MIVCPKCDDVQPPTTSEIDEIWCVYCGARLLLTKPDAREIWLRELRRIREGRRPPKAVS